MLDLTQLRSFREVAERGTVAAAAAALGYTAPAVSQHLGKLERSLDVLLFDRVGGLLALTPAGEALLPVAHELLDLAARAADVVRTTPPRPSVTVAGLASAIAALLVPQLAGLVTEASVVVVEAEDTEALRELRLGGVDVAIIQEYPGDQSRRDPRLTYTPVCTDELRLVLPPSRPASTTIADLAGLPWLVNGTGTRCEAATREVLRTVGVDAEVSGDVTDNRLLLQLVAAGHGATIVPDLVLVDVGPSVTVATDPVGVTRTILLVTRGTPTGGVLAVVEAIARERQTVATRSSSPRMVASASPRPAK
jgi:DNA-binding transcriptional LysR family regulator